MLNDDDNDEQLQSQEDIFSPRFKQVEPDQVDIPSLDWDLAVSRSNGNQEIAREMMESNNN